MLLNFTGHDLNVYREEDCIVNDRNQLTVPNGMNPAFVLKPKGCIRAKSIQKTVDFVKVTDGLKLRVNEVAYGEPYGIPQDYNPDDEDNYYIVSVLAAKAMNSKYGKTLNNLITVNNTVRDNKGSIIGCSGFSKVY